jgi:aryl-alcohol dehydrogenase-like predicted oxidoreductase
MKTVHLGNTNLQVSPFCLGAMMFGGKTDRGEGRGRGQLSELAALVRDYRLIP